MWKKCILRKYNKGDRKMRKLNEALNRLNECVRNSDDEISRKEIIDILNNK